MRRELSKRLAWILVVSGAMAWLSGCRASGEAPVHLGIDDGTADGGSLDAGALGTATGGLPCGIEELLTTRCQGCHSAHPSAPMPLVTYADLVAPSKSDPTKKVYALALERMTSATQPMPPSAPLGAAEIAAFETWVKAGAASGSCGADGIEGGVRDAGLPECVLASDCPGDLVCRGGLCDVECVTNKDCTPTWSCVETRCQPPPPSAGPGDASASSPYREMTSAASWSIATGIGLPTGSYSGTVFDGRYVYFAPDGAGAAALRYDTTLPFGAVRAWSTFDLSAMNASAANYRGAVFDGRYVYLVPSSAGGILARFDTHAAYRDGSSWALFDLKTVSSAVAFVGATFDGRYVYLVPSDGAALSFRYDTQGALDARSSWSTFAIRSFDANVRSFAGAVFDGRYVYYVPLGTATGPQGVIARYDVDAPFDSATSWVTLDLATLDPKAVGYRTGAFDGRYLYLVPGWTAPTPSWASSTIARYDTRATFGATASWKFFDTTNVDPKAAGFNAATFDGRHLLLAPAFNSAYHGVTLRFDTGGSLTSTGSWSKFDTTSLGSGARNMRGASFDGRYVYFAPSSGTAVRFEARTSSAPAGPPMLGGSFY